MISIVDSDWLLIPSLSIIWLAIAIDRLIQAKIISLLNRITPGTLANSIKDDFGSNKTNRFNGRRLLERKWRRQVVMWRHCATRSINPCNENVNEAP